MLDANVIIKLHELGIWGAFLTRVEVHVAQTVVDEARFWVDEEKARHEIDLREDIREKRIAEVFSLDAVELASFLARFDDATAPDIDPGERESIAWIDRTGKDYKLCSADYAVYRVLGLLGLGEKGLSLEEILHKIGMSRKLPMQFTKGVRERLTQAGVEDGIRGRGLRKKS